MARKVITVTHPDGTKKIIVGKESNMNPIKTREEDEKKRAKPGTPKVGLTTEKNGYKYGGKIKFKAC